MNKVSITVGIPFYHKTTLEELALSINSILKQTFLPYEIHLIQDGPISKELANLVVDYLSRNDFIKHIKLDKSNLSTALNNSIKLTKTKYYARMDSDDISMVDRLEVQYDFLEKNKYIDILGSWAIEFDADIDDVNNFVKKVPDKNSEIINFFHYRNPLIHPTVMFRTDVFNIIGYYNENFNTDQDLELWGRSINAKVGINNIQKPLLYHRVSGIHNRRTRVQAIRNQILARRLIPAKRLKFKVLKFLAICFRFMPKQIIKYSYKKLR